MFASRGYCIASQATVGSWGGVRMNGWFRLCLLIALFEADAVAMENCGEHDWEVTCAYQRAAGVMAKAATNLPSAEVERRITALIDGDGYGVRSGLALPFTASQRLAE